MSRTLFGLCLQGVDFSLQRNLSLAFRFEYCTVKPLISILIRSHLRVESTKSEYFDLNLGIFIRKAAMKDSS